MPTTLSPSRSRSRSWWRASTRWAGARGYVAKPTVLRVGGLSFDRETLVVRRGERVLTLTAKELALLELLMSAPGKVFSRARIPSNVWGLSADPLTNVVDVYVRRLRAKIEPDGEPPLIRTVRGHGYKIDADGNGAG